MSLGTKQSKIPHHILNLCVSTLGCFMFSPFHSSARETRSSSPNYSHLLTPPLVHRTFRSPHQPEPVCNLACRENDSLHSITPWDGVCFSFSYSKASGRIACGCGDNWGEAGTALTPGIVVLGREGGSCLGVCHWSHWIGWKKFTSFFLFFFEIQNKGPQYQPGI